MIPIIDESNRWLDRLNQQGDGAMQRLLRQYAAAQQRIEREIAAVERQLRQAREEEAIRARMFRLDRYRALLEQVANEMNSIGGIAAQLSLRLNQDAALAGAQSGINMGVLSGRESEIAVGTFMRLDPETIARAAAFVNPGSPLYRSLQNDYGQIWAEVFAQQFVTGIVLGWNPRKIADILRRTADTAIPANLEAIIRTAQLWTYRLTQHDVWRRSGLVDYWVWHAQLGDLRTCGGCWAMHGTHLSVNEALNDHYSGRCVAIPHVIESPDLPPHELDIPMGESVFSSLSRERQEAIAQHGGWGAHLRAWRAGAISFDQLSRVFSGDPIYGNMRGQASLKSILGLAAKKYYRGRAASLIDVLLGGIRDIAAEREQDGAGE